MKKYQFLFLLIASLLSFACGSGGVHMETRSPAEIKAENDRLNRENRDLRVQLDADRASKRYTQGTAPAAPTAEVQAVTMDNGPQVATPYQFMDPAAAQWQASQDSMFCSVFSVGFAYLDAAASDCGDNCVRLVVIERRMIRGSFMSVELDGVPLKACDHGNLSAGVTEFVKRDKQADPLPIGILPVPSNSRTGIRIAVGPGDHSVVVTYYTLFGGMYRHVQREELTVNPARIHSNGYLGLRVARSR